MGMAWGLGKLLNRGPPVLRTLPWLIPAVASASAGSSNLLFMRMNEITDGNIHLGLQALSNSPKVLQRTELTFHLLLSSVCWDDIRSPRYDT